MRLKSFAAPGLLVILAARAEIQGRTIRVSAFYSPSLASYVARDGTFPMVVRGSPFATPVAAR